MVFKSLILAAFLHQSALKATEWDWEVHTEIDRPRGQIVFRVDNNLPQPIQVTLDELTWNDATVKQSLPKKVTIAANSKIVWRFDPVHPRVAEFGDLVAHSGSVFQKGKPVEETSNKTGVSGLIPGMMYRSLPQDDLDLRLTRLRVLPRYTKPGPPSHESELYPVDVRNVRLVRGTAVIAEVIGVHTLSKKRDLLIANRIEPKDRKGLYVTYEYRLTPWSVWRTSDKHKIRCEKTR